MFIFVDDAAYLICTACSTDTVSLHTTRMYLASKTVNFRILIDDTPFSRSYEENENSPLLMIPSPSLHPIKCSFWFVVAGLSFQRKRIKKRENDTINNVVFSTVRSVEYSRPVRLCSATQ